jgi:hypothetical protein
MTASTFVLVGDAFPADATVSLQDRRGGDSPPLLAGQAGPATWLAIRAIFPGDLIGVLRVGRPAARQPAQGGCRPSEVVPQPPKVQRLIDQAALARCLGAWLEGVGRQPAELGADTHVGAGEFDPRAGLAGDADAGHVVAWRLRPERGQVRGLLDHLAGRDERVQSERAGDGKVVASDRLHIGCGVGAVRAGQQVGGDLVAARRGGASSELDGLTVPGCGLCGGTNGLPKCSQMAWAMASPALLA